MTHSPSQIPKAQLFNQASVASQSRNKIPPTRKRIPLTRKPRRVELVSSIKSKDKQTEERKRSQESQRQESLR